MAFTGSFNKGGECMLMDETVVLRGLTLHSWGDHIGRLLNRVGCEDHLQADQELVRGTRDHSHREVYSVPCSCGKVHHLHPRS